MSIVVDQVYKSRFGFHPCSRETFLKLKALHKAYWQALKDHATWMRWDRKLPHNRVIREYLRDADGRRCGVASTRPRPEPPKWCPVFTGRSKWSLDGHGIVDLYQQARMPSAEPVQVWTNLDKIDCLYSQLVEWQQNQ